MTVAELLGRISSQELTEWQAFFKLEPWGTEVELLGHAQTAATLANINRGKGTQPYSVKDFMPKFDKKPQTVNEMKAALQSWAAAVED